MIQAQCNSCGVKRFFDVGGAGAGRDGISDAQTSR
jgi:hypothetical protein